LVVNNDCIFHSWWDVLDTTLCDKLVSEFRQIAGFLGYSGFPPPIKLTTTVSTITLSLTSITFHYLIIVLFDRYQVHYYTQSLFTTNITRGWFSGRKTTRDRGEI
jgi:hypothetical protein